MDRHGFGHRVDPRTAASDESRGGGFESGTSGRDDATVWRRPMGGNTHGSGSGDGAYGGLPEPTIQAPGRRILNTMEVLLPSGAMREFYLEVETYLELPLTYVTRRRSGFRPALDCSCQPRGPWDISECANAGCRWVTCLAHSDSCPFCGQVFCTKCLTIVYVEGLPVVVCRRCAEELTLSLLGKLLKWLMRERYAE